MKHPSNPAGACSVDEQVDIDLDVKSDSAFCHDTDGSATESPRAWVLKSAEVLLKLSLGKALCLVEELRSIFYGSKV